MIDQMESVTAKLCAFVRAYHSNISKDKVFDDYLAYDMLGKDEYIALKELLQCELSEVIGCNQDAYEQVKEYIAPIVLSRVSFTEEELERFVQKHGNVQYVISGAGFDTFSFRNSNPNIEVYEIDHPDTQRYKRSKIEELQWNIPSNVHFVAVDFEIDDLVEELLKSGFDPNKKTFFSILGVSYYLTLDTFTETIKKFATISARGSEIVFDYPDESTLDETKATERITNLTKITEYLGEKMEKGYQLQDVTNALSKFHYDIKKYLSPQNIQIKYLDNSEHLKAFENVHMILAKYQ